ncbi:MAG: hypothetical protein AAFO29_09725 [Actinomycetota bacterium]
MMVRAAGGLLGLVLVVGAGCSVLEPTPERILSDGVVTEDEYRDALDRVVDCVADQGGEFEYSFAERDRAVTMAATGDGDLDVIIDECLARHVGEVEFVWADQHGPSPEDEAQFYNEVVSCVEDELGVEFGEVQPRAGGGVDTSVTNAAIDADPDLYDRCFDVAVARRP